MLDENEFEQVLIELLLGGEAYTSGEPIKVGTPAALERRARRAQRERS